MGESTISSFQEKAIISPAIKHTRMNRGAASKNQNRPRKYGSKRGGLVHSANTGNINIYFVQIKQDIETKKKFTYG